MAAIELHLGGTMEDAPFTDIAGEVMRAYIFPEEHLPDGRVRPLHKVIINKPQWLNVSESGGHRILDIDGICHYIPCGWKELYWLSKAGDCHFVT